MNRKQKYEKAVKAWDWNRIQASAKKEEGRTYLGRVFTLLPSGKFYQPYANSNVADDCPQCKGTGRLWNRHHAPLLLAGFKAARAELTQRNLAANRLFFQWSEEDRQRAQALDVEIDRYGEHRMCLVCRGSGSASVARDEDFMEALQAVAARYGGSVVSNPGDPTDLLFQLYGD